MMGLLATSPSSLAAGDSDLDVARGWYLWRTGQEEAAAAHARELVAAHPEDLGAHRLFIAMEVVQGNGASMEAAYRDAWGMDSSDPANRVALAFAVTQRRTATGAWCDEVTTLVAPVVDGEAHYWATIAERLRDQRCTGSTDHADAELRRIAKDGGVGWADGVLARVKAGYLKQDLPADLERLWAEAPHRLDESAALWADHVAGPARAKSRSVTSKALDSAAQGSDPMLVYAALQAFGALGKDGKATKAEARLASLDAAARLDVRRTVEDVEDPPIYGTIDACTTKLTVDEILECLDGVEGIPESGSVAAHYQARRREAFVAASEPELAQEAARLAWVADPDHRHNARVFTRQTLALEQASEADRALAVDAAAIVASTEIGADLADLSERQRRWLARDLQLQSKTLAAADRPGDAIEGQLRAIELDATPKRRLVLGSLLAAAGRDHDAVLQLVAGLARETEDTEGIRVGRELLGRLDGGWHPQGMPGMLREVARGPEDRVPTHPLVGRRTPKLDAFIPDPPADDEEPPLAVVLVTWAPFEPGSQQALERLEGIAQRYAARRVAFVAVSSGLQEPEPEPEAEAENAPASLLQHRYGGADAMRALRAVALPTAAVIDTKRGRITSVMAPYHATTLTLEEALDEILPEEEITDDEQ